MKLDVGCGDRPRGDVNTDLLLDGRLTSIERMESSIPKSFQIL